MSDIVALVLAAGRATRFGSGPETSKVLAALDGAPLVRRVAAIALASRVHSTVVVTGHAAAGVLDALAGLPVRCVHNPLYAEGMASSLQAGLAAMDTQTRGVVVLLADMPRVTSVIIDRLIERFEAADGLADAVVPVREGRRGNPVLLGRSIFAAVSTLTGDQGARRLLVNGGDRILACPTDDPAIEIDVDTREALAALEGGS